MADQRGTPGKAEPHSRDNSDSTVGPATGPGSSMSNRSSTLQVTTPQARKTSVSVRDPSATMSYVPSEMDMSGVSATEYSSGEEEGSTHRQVSRPAGLRGRAGTLGSMHRAAVSQGSAAPSVSKGKRRASTALRAGEREASKGRRQSRDRVLDDDGEDELADRFGPLDDEDDEVEHIDRGEELVRRRMKARQKEKAARKKAEKEKQQQLARLQTSQAQLAGSSGPPLSPKTRQASKQQILPTPSPLLEREGRPMHISLPPPEFGSHLPASTSPKGPLSPGLRQPLNYPSPHSHIRRPSTRTSAVDPTAVGRRVSGTSTGNYSSTVAATRGPPTPHQAQTGDVFSPEVAPSEAETASSIHVPSVHPDEEDEGRDTVAGLARDVGAPRSEVEASHVDEEADDGLAADGQLAEDGDGDEVDGDDDASGETGEDGSDEDVEYTLKDRQDAINIEHPFGLPIWKPALYKKSRSVTRNAESALHSIPSAAAERHLLPANLLWTAFAGLWLSLICFIMAFVVNLLPLGGSKYARVIWELGGYLFWPFGKYVEVEVEPGSKERLATFVGANDYPDPENEPAQDETYEDSFTPVAARFPHDHKHTVPFNSRSASNLDLSNHDTIRPGDTIAAYKAIDDQKRSSGSGSSGEERPTSANAEGSSGKDYGTAKGLEEGLAPYTEEERICQEMDIYGYVEDDQGRDIGGMGRLVGTIAYGIALWLLIAPLMGLVCLSCWGLVFPIPMAKLNWVLLKNLGTRPLALRFRSAPRVDAPDAATSSESAPLLGRKRSILQQLKAGEPAPRTAKQSRDGRLMRRSRILVCTYRAMGLQYYKYTVGGVNILFVNTLPFVVFTIFDFFFVEPYVEHHKIQSGFLAAISSKGAMFVFALGSVIPLSYFIGMAVASISAQSSIGMGSVINATFGSIIEIILYGIALTQDKARLVEGSLVGSILAGVLLMPGVSMCSGAMRRKEQRFNARSAGVTSTMLIMAIIGILTPTLFYQIYGTFQLTCKGCPTDTLPGEAWTCKRCFYEHVPPATDPFYQENVKGLMYTCTVVLVLSYGIGLWFSLRTHASQIWQNPQSQAPLSVPQQLAGPVATTNAGHSSYPHGGAAQTSGNGTQQLPHSGLQLSNLPAGQRASIYKRILPAGILQQLMPSTHRVTSGQSQTVRSNQSRATILSENLHDRESISGGPPPLHLPDSISVEDYERAMGSVGQTQQSSAPGLGNRRSSVLAQDHGRQSSQQHQEVARNSAAPHAGHDGDGSGGGHEAPSWTRATSMMVLLSCTVLYAIIAEILVDAVDVVLDGSGLDIKLLGVTLFALVPNATEFMNAMSFAINGNIALSMEIGSAYALQVCLIQIPAMVAFSAFYQAHNSHDNDVNSTFTLIFPRWDVIAIIFSIFLLTYTYIESRSNYFRGSLCILSYIVLISGFVFAPNTGDPEDPVEDQPRLLRAIGFGGLQPIMPAIPLATQFQAVLNSLWTR